MSADLYAAVIVDLEAKRDGLNELIAALQNVSRLLPGQSATQLVEATKADNGRSVGRSVQDACHRPRRPHRPGGRPMGQPRESRGVTETPAATRP